MKRSSMPSVGRFLSVLGAMSAQATFGASTSPSLPQGFDHKPLDTQVAVARVDMPGTGETYEKTRDAHLAQWRGFAELARNLQQPAPPAPVFAPGYDQPSRVETSRFVKLDRTADVRLSTHFGYACKYNESRPDPMMHGLVCSPTVSRFITLYKLIDGRVHRWEANLNDRTGTYSVSERSAQQRLPRGDEGSLPLDQLGPRIGEAEYLGFTCEIRAVGEVRACYYVQQSGLPQALEGIAAWRRHNTDEKRYTRLGAVVTSTQLGAAYFEPPAGIAFTGNRAGGVR
jgi:hypothetical protein